MECSLAERMSERAEENKSGAATSSHSSAKKIIMDLKGVHGNKDRLYHTEKKTYTHTEKRKRKQCTF